MEAEATNVGTYEPAPYLVPGLFARLGNDADTALRLARAGNAIVSLAMLGSAVALARRRPGMLVGVLVAATPMVMFLAASASASGPEIVSALLFVVALLTVGRDSGHSAAWMAVGLSGTVLALSRSLGPVWVVLLTAAVLVGGGGGIRLGIRSRAGPRAAAVAVVVAMAATAVWEVAFQPHPGLDLGEALGDVGTAISSLPSAAKQMVGVFGAIDVPMPKETYAVWAVLVAGLVALAGRDADRRGRLVLAALVIGTAAVTVGVAVGAVYPTGFQMQGRYTLPLAVAVPVYAGALIGPSLERAKWLVPAAIAMVAMVQLVGWYTNARRYAVSMLGPWRFFDAALWDPPLGWYTVTAVCVAGAVCLVAGGLVVWSEDRADDLSST